MKKQLGILSYNQSVFIYAIIFLSVFLSDAFAVGLDTFKKLKGVISISGGTAHYPVMNELKYNIEKFNPNILIAIKGGGSSLGIKQVGEGIVDIGNSGRPLKPQEQEQYNLQSIPFAYDAIAIIVHPDNPVSNLSSDAIKKIYFGEIKNWKELGGLDQTISIYDRNEGSGTKSIFIKKLLKKETVVKRQLISNHDEMKIAVSWDKNGIGYMSLGHVNKNKLKALLLDGIEPSLANTISGKYILSRKLYMNISADSSKVSELTRRFTHYVTRSPETAIVIKNSGYLPLH